MNVVESSDARRVSLTGEATGTPVLFPKMDAELVIARVGDDLTQVKTEGQYAPPLGGFGRLIDQAFLHRVAEATSKELVDRIVEELDAEQSVAGWRLATGDRRLTPSGPATSPSRCARRSVPFRCDRPRASS